MLLILICYKNCETVIHFLGFVPCTAHSGSIPGSVIPSNTWLHACSALISLPAVQLVPGSVAKLRFSPERRFHTRFSYNENQPNKRSLVFKLTKIACNLTNLQLRFSTPSIHLLLIRAPFDFCIRYTMIRWRCRLRSSSVYFACKYTDTVLLLISEC